MIDLNCKQGKVRRAAIKCIASKLHYLGHYAGTQGADGVGDEQAEKLGIVEIMPGLAIAIDAGRDHRDVAIIESVLQLQKAKDVFLLELGVATKKVNVTRWSIMFNSGKKPSHASMAVCKQECHNPENEKPTDRY